MPITALPTPPTRSDPVNFNSRADAFLAALPTFATEANTLQTDVNAKQTAAAASAANALASELAAAASSNATVWVSGTTYAVGNVRFSPITFLSYRRKTSGAGTTDPSADSTNWQLINGTGNVDLDSTQTLTNKTFSTGSVWNGSAVPIANGGTGATTAVNAFNALKQNATDTVSGVVELATTSEASTGTDTTRAVTAAGLEAHMLNNELGWGQSQQTFTRSINTSYQNTTGRPIFVSIFGRTDGSRSLQVSIDNTNWISVTQLTASSESGTSSCMIVPSGWYYRVSGSGGSIFLWSELR